MKAKSIDEAKSMAKSQSLETKYKTDMYEKLRAIKKQLDDNKI